MTDAARGGEGIRNSEQLPAPHALLALIWSGAEPGWAELSTEIPVEITESHCKLSPELSWRCQLTEHLRVQIIQHYLSHN